MRKNYQAPNPDKKKEPKPCAPHIYRLHSSGVWKCKCGAELPKAKPIVKPS